MHNWWRRIPSWMLAAGCRLLQADIALTTTAVLWGHGSSSQTQPEVGCSRSWFVPLSKFSRSKPIGTHIRKFVEPAECSRAIESSDISYPYYRHTKPCVSSDYYSPWLGEPFSLKYVSSPDSDQWQLPVAQCHLILSWTEGLLYIELGEPITRVTYG